MRALTSIVLMSLLSLPAFSQQTLVETIEVRVANIDVVVRDRQGNPVTGLTKDDFILEQDGIPQTITNFYEVRRVDEAANASSSEPDVPLALRQRRVVIFVDSASLTPSRGRTILDSVARFVDNRMRPEDLAMLVTWRLGLRIVTPFTNDRGKLKQGLDAIAHYGPAGEANQRSISYLKREIHALVDTAEREEARPAPLLSWDQAYNDARRLVDRHSEQLIVQQQKLLDAIDQVAADMAGLEGKKVLVLVGEHFPQRPGAELYRYIDNVFTPHMNLRDNLDLEAVSGVTGNSLPNAIEQLAKDAAANGVTIYAIGTPSGDVDLSAENNIAADFGYTFSRDTNTASALGVIAETTGGIAITGTTNFDLAFDTIHRDLASYYSLGYKPQEGGRTQHKVIVRTKNRAYTIRARQTFVAKSTEDDMTDRAIANLYTDPGHNDWRIAVRTGTPKREDGKFMVPVQVVIPATITLLPDQDSLAGNFVLYFVVGGHDGATSSVMRRPAALKIPKSAEAAVRAKPMTFNTAIRVNPGESDLSVAIIDQVSGTTGFARTKIVAR